MADAFIQTPWRVNGSEVNTSIWVEDAGGQRVCTVRNCDNDAERANLIAAAPELYAALQDAIGKLDDAATLADSAGFYGYYKVSADKARAALAKVQGA
jgi:hypothetical protein